MKMATCHPGRRRGHSSGLCQGCYRRAREAGTIPSKRATCHPDRPHRSRGLCQPCYMKASRVGDFASAGQATCHPDRKTYALALCLSCYRQKQRKTSPARQPWALRAKRYNTSQEDLRRLFRAQDAKCASCSAELLEGSRFTHVDHDHETGGIRGILCYSCNTTLGNAKDNLVRLRACADYLERYRLRVAA